MIAAVIRSHGFDIDVSPPSRFGSIEDYDVVVLGSAVYAGQWLKPALKFARMYELSLRERAVWLFSCGPVGNPPSPLEGPAGIAQLAKSTQARGHRLFPGRLDRERLNPIEKLMAAAFHAPEGDFRDWQSVQNWADEIAEALRAGEARWKLDDVSPDCAGGLCDAGSRPVDEPAPLRVLCTL